VCVLKEGLELEETDDEEKAAREAEATEFAELCTTVKDALGDNIEKVFVSNCMILLASSLLVSPSNTVVLVLCWATSRTMRMGRSTETRGVSALRFDQVRPPIL